MTAANPGGLQALLESLDLKLLTIQRTAAGRWWNFARVISPFSRLWLVLKGRASVRHHGQEYVLKPGCIHLVPAFTAHDCIGSQHFDHFHLHLSARVPTGIDLFSLLDCKWNLGADPRALSAFERLEQIHPDRKLPCFDPFVEEYRRAAVSLQFDAAHNRPADWLETQGLLRLLLAPFLRTAALHESGLHSQVNRQFLAVQEYIHQHMQRPIRLAQLAKVTGLHPTYFSDRFLQLVGVRPLEYLTRRRVEKAQYLLLTTRASIKEVAYAVGIPDPAYFTRVFTRLCHVAPSAYRQAHS